MRPDLDAIRARWPDGRLANTDAREDVLALLAHVEELEAETATLRHRDVLLKRVHGALLDMCCRVPTSIDEPVDAIIRAALARANQRFVDEYDARVSAEEWASELREELFEWQDVVEYMLGKDWMAEGHGPKEARAELARRAKKSADEYGTLLEERDEERMRTRCFEQALAEAQTDVYMETKSNVELREKLHELRTRSIDAIATRLRGTVCSFAVGAEMVTIPGEQVAALLEGFIAP